MEIEISDLQVANCLFVVISLTIYVITNQTFHTLIPGMNSQVATRGDESPFECAAREVP